MTTVQALQLLGLDRDFTPQDLKKAYRRKAAQTHPDMGGSEAEFHEVNTAYELLLNPPKEAVGMLITHKTIFNIKKRG